MRWTNELIESEIKLLMEELGIDRMPKAMEMRNNGKSGLSRAIGLSGGYSKWSEKLGLEMEVKERKWNDSLIESELLKSIQTLGLKRMPTADELKSIGRNDLHCKISRTKKYSGWAAELNLDLKRSDTSFGQEWEKKVSSVLESYGHEVEIMTTKHPYDLLIDNSVKVDVKVSNPYHSRNSTIHTFSLSKSKPTCDIYILLALGNNGIEERTLVIPSHHVQMTMINLGKESKYNIYNGKWDLVKRYSDFFKGIN